MKGEKGFQPGHTPWSKGKTRADDPRIVAKFGEDNHFWGKHHSEETRKKMVENRGEYKWSNETREKTMASKGTFYKSDRYKNIREEWSRKISLGKLNSKIPPYRKYAVDETSFDKCSNGETSYWIGFLMADGAIVSRSGSRSVALCLQERDVEILESFRLFVKSTAPIKVDKHHRVNFVISSNRMCASLSKYGIVERKTGKEQIANIPPEYIKDFIRGYFDGDGCISFNGKHISVRFCCNSKEFIQEIDKHIEKNCGISTTKIWSPEGKGCHYTHYGRDEGVKRIFHYLYDGASVYLKRKFRRFITPELVQLGVPT
mgnify:CR=1 FL=1